MGQRHPTSQQKCSSHPGPKTAPGSTTAVGWMRAEAGCDERLGNATAAPSLGRAAQEAREGPRGPRLREAKGAGGVGRVNTNTAPLVEGPPEEADEEELQRREKSLALGQPVKAAHAIDTKDGATGCGGGEREGDKGAKGSPSVEIESGLRIDMKFPSLFIRGGRLAFPQRPGDGAGWPIATHQSAQPPGGCISKWGKPKELKTEF